MMRTLGRLRRGVARALHWAASRLMPVENHATSPYEIDKRFLKRFLPSNPVIVEAGAHIGSDTLELSLVWPDAQIHSFEPIPNLFIRTSRWTAHASGVILYPFALGSGRSWQLINVSSGASDASSSLLQPKQHLEQHPDVHFVGVLEVPTISLDEWSETYGVASVDMLWLDLQGFELQALKGGERLLTTVRVIYTEVSLKEVYEGGAPYHEIASWLREKGFVMLKEYLPFPDSGNVLFVRERGLEAVTF